jgi:hypothetical protein
MYNLRMKLAHYGEIAIDLVVAVVVYYYAHWIGFALWVFFVLCNYGYQIADSQKTIMNTLLSRLPDRCAMCHREIVDEGGTIDDAEDGGIYHGVWTSWKPYAPDLRGRHLSNIFGSSLGHKLGHNRA